MSATLRQDRLRDFIGKLAAEVESADDEESLLRQGRPLLAELVRHDDWLDEAFAQPHPDHYQQYLLHVDSRQRFSVVSFVWGPGQFTPVHDHRVWGLIGLLRGAERSQSFARRDGRLAEDGPPVLLRPGEVEAVSPNIGDIHRVSNALDDAVSISIHVYGANIGAVRRAVYDADGREKTFISGYSNTLLPNIWDLSRQQQ
ncbi:MULTISPECIES: cysteine dioxygenase [Brenneria]|uniref:Cysteine dioxygenase n=1 Tax=Brenneria nigrifluens DSM 30175 = ATCC 13028 TaxID=1121120 RepID=A0A2U1UV62_9GAMM|nr:MULTISPECIES: cysteine dioxygenase [Brenneria]EHD20059.1 cysteine dioxygenase type I protein [Brenneria sp. EniD312]PWC25537.1 cysteine dioxygenase [Brenneria nigrifluens] [Brenneria nigrifluens DSM 30175 = ATCC 13028]QCR03298.1 cysteine dioxygenase [Brenneria nigrifluens] [Brenneria nigrifluens DSM 30175 = ATCC 13028]